PPRCSKENVQDAPINQAQRLGAEQGHQGLRLRQDAVVPLERITFEKGTLTTLRAWGQIKLLDRRGERHNVVEVIQVVHDSIRARWADACSPSDRSTHDRPNLWRERQVSAGSACS